ncbi:MAG TPA: chromosomal replication initiator protein DnaA, partial [Clostridiales bacterium]|nr:chromosomal replication initiator protein DnaA [Clostridiales bacterium]
DIQFIIGKEQTQEEIFHTFNAMYENNKQIILSSDKHAKALSPLEDRLKSRFASGLIVDVQPPEYETRRAIIDTIVKKNQIGIPEEVLNVIALRISSNNRELESALNKVVLYAKNVKKPIDVEIAELALSNEFGRNRPSKLDCSAICEAVSRYFDINMQDLFSQKKSREYSHPRQIAMFLCRDLCDISYPNIGKSFGGKDHTTIMHAVQKVSRLYDEDSRIRKEIEDIRKNHLGR